MQVVYIAGPYRAKTLFGVIINILRARLVARKLWKRGYAVICPHSNSALFTNISEEIFIIGDLELLSRCDLMVVCGKWEKSTGTIGEITYAEQYGIPIIYWDCIDENENLGGTFDELDITSDSMDICNNNLADSFSTNKN